MERYAVDVDPRDGKYYCVVDRHKNNQIVEEIQDGEVTGSSIIEFVIKIETEMDKRCKVLNEEYNTYLRRVTALN